MKKPKSGTLSAFLFFLSMSLLAHAQSHQSCPLHLTLNRVIALRSSSYVYTCDCTTEDREIITIGRARVEIPSALPDTAAQSSATIRCILKDESRLLRICKRDSQRFDRQTLKTMERCVKIKPKPFDLRRKGKFRFSTKKCKTYLLRFFGARTAGVWICSCDNENFNVVTGRAAFITDDSPLGASREAEIVRACGKNMEKQMNEVCKSSPEDFGILGLQLLQVCCKRGRVRLPNGKFGCAAIVPDDLSALKATS